MDPIAVLRVSGSFKRDKPKEAVAVYRTDEAEHPGVKAVYDSGDYCLAGSPCWRPASPYPSSSPRS